MATPLRLPTRTARTFPAAPDPNASQVAFARPLEYQDRQAVKPASALVLIPISVAAMMVIVTNRFLIILSFHQFLVQDLPILLVNQLLAELETVCTEPKVDLFEQARFLGSC
jgi:hypothetical protein